MEELRKQVRRAQWWLGVQRFMGALGFSLFGTLLLALVLILVDKYWPLGLQAWAWGAGAVGLGFVLAIVWAVISGRGSVDAAIEIDRRFGLKERVSSTLAMTDEELESEVGQALVHDAVRRVERIDVSEHFAVSPGRQLFLPLVPAVAAFLVAIFMNPASENPADAKTDPNAVLQQIENANKSLQLKLAEQREQAKKQGLEDADKLFRKLQEELDKQDPNFKSDKQEAMVKLNDLAEKLAKRTEELGGAEQLQKQLEQLQNIDRGPADKFLQAVGKGDFQKAKQELEKLRQKMADGKLNEQEKEQLAKQLKQMQENLNKVAEAHRKTMEDLKKQIEQAKQAGNKDQAEKLQQQLNNLQNQLPQMQQLQQLAQKMGQCQQCMQNGQMKEAADMLAGMEGDLKQMEQKLQEFKMMQDAMEQLEQARAQMNCKACGGKGCKACQRPGNGLGEGRGFGPRPEEESDKNFFDTKASTKATPGAGDVVGEVEGPSLKGDAQAVLLEQERKGRVEASDPLTDQRMPRKHQENSRDYFNRFNEGK